MPSVLPVEKARTLVNIGPHFLTMNLTKLSILNDMF